MIVFIWFYPLLKDKEENRAALRVGMIAEHHSPAFLPSLFPLLTLED